jgi:predicted kinase
MENKMSKLYLIIGIPGSGKTTKAKEIIEAYKAEGKEIRHYEADMFFEKDGEYKFEFFNLGKAHNWCFNNTREALKNGIDVIVSNTSLTPEERGPYLRLVKRFKCELEVITMTGEYENVHGVPKGKLEFMKKRYIPYSDEELANIR